MSRPLMLSLSQSPTGPDFFQPPYPFYDCLRAGGDIAFREEYGMPCAVSHRAVWALLRDRRLGREPLPEPVQVSRNTSRRSMRSRHIPCWTSNHRGTPACASLHFGVGAPLARLELATALPVLFQRRPDFALSGAPRHANLYHFHGLDALRVHY
ncbi:hypothetical protein [Sagittula salina]|uniref:Uncharacterized protein n=1 Tax=Sagittula salina TaxID=2820268 RepID=A0A940S1E7_9RHOB|nr:hypothetical protein [Sagittula salina]